MSLKTLALNPSGKTPRAFMKRQCDLRLRFVLVECNPRRSAQSGDQIRYKEYSGSCSQRQSRGCRGPLSRLESWGVGMSQLRRRVRFKNRLLITSTDAT